MSRRAIAAGLALIPIVLVGLGLRSVTAEYVLSGDAVNFYGNDAYYHARRVALVQQGEIDAAMVRDAYLNYPHGAVVPWPPGFDVLLAGVAGLFGGDDGEGRDLALAATMPVLGVLAVLLLYLLAMALYRDRAIALTAAGLMAVLPAAAGVSLLGRIDHHALVAVVLLLFLYALVSAANAGGPGARRAWTMVAGIAAAAALLSWPSTPWLYLALAVGAAGLGQALQLRAGDEGSALPGPVPTAAALGLAALLVGVVLILVPPERACDFSAHSHVALLGAVGLAATSAIVAAGARPLARRPKGWLVLLGGAALFGAIAHLPFLYCVSGEHGLTGALSLLLARDPLIAGLSESQPLLGDPVNALEQWTGLLLLAPAVLAAAVLGPLTYGSRSARTLLACLAWPLALLTLVQQRFGEAWAPLYCLCLALVIVALARRMRERTRAWRLVTVAGGVLILGGALAPAALAYAAGLAGGEGPGAAISEICGRRFADAQQTGQGRPGAGAYAAWSRGNLVLYRCGLAPVANPMATEDIRQGIERVARITLSRDDDPAADIEGDVRYWLVHPPAPTVRFYAGLLGEDPDQYAAPGAELDPAGKLTEEYFATTVARLAHFDGAPMRFKGRVYPPLAGFRLIDEAGPPLRPGPGVGRLVKLYERVPGARLVGLAVPGETVFLKARIRLPGGRDFEYLDEAGADADGRWERRVPYPVGSPADGGCARARYWAVAGERSARVQVTREAVYQGLDVEVVLQGPDVAPEE